MDANYTNYNPCLSKASSTFQDKASAQLEQLSEKIEVFIRFSKKNFTPFEPNFEAAHKLAVNKISKNPSKEDLTFLCCYKFGHEVHTQSIISYVQMPMEIMQLIFIFRYPNLEFRSFDDNIHKYIEMNSVNFSCRPIVNNLLRNYSDYSG